MANLLMSRIYFFIPLKEVKNDYAKGLDGGVNINPPAYLKQFGDSLKYHTLKELEADFYFFRDTDRKKIALVHVNVFLLGYHPQEKSEKWNYYLAVGMDQGNQFKCVTNNQEPLVTIHDIIMLKSAFGESLNEEKPTLLSCKHKEKGFAQWFYNDVLKVVSGTRQNIKYELPYSLTEVRIVNAGKIRPNAENYNAEFSAKYFGKNGDSLRDALGKDYPIIAYGLLHGRDNYHSLCINEIATNLQHLYSDLVTERFYSVEKSLLFISTHYPFKYWREAKQTFDNGITFNFAELSNLWEICIEIYKDQQMKVCQHIVESEKDPVLIRKEIARMVKYFNDKHCHIYELDEKMRFMDETWRLNQMMAEIKERVEQYSLAATTEKTWAISFIALAVTVMSFLLMLFNSIRFFVSF